MATLGGAKAVGLDHVCGSLVVGKQADMVALRFDGISMSPMYSPVSHVVYVSTKEEYVCSAHARYPELRALCFVLRALCPVPCVIGCVYSPHPPPTPTRDQCRVTHVWVDGVPLLIERTLTTLSPADILRDSRKWAAIVTAK